MATEILRPNASGDETNLTPIPSVENWENVDEETHDSDATYVRDVTSWARDLYNVADTGVGGGTINHIIVYAVCKSFYNHIDQTAIIVTIKSGTGTGAPDTIGEGDEETPTTSWEAYSNQWDTNPATGNAWTWDEIDKLQIGVSLRDCDSGGADKVGCTQVYVEIDYTAGATEKTSADAGSGVDAVDSLQTPQAKTSSDAGSGAEGTPLPNAILASSETGSGIEALFARLLAAAIDTGTGVETANVSVEGLLKELTATETAEGSDRLTAKIEIPAKGGGMKLWT